MDRAIHDAVREHYAAAAIRASRRTGCGSGDRAGARCGDVSPDDVLALYPRSELATLPGPALDAALGCGYPLAAVELVPGERVLDLGSGGGVDVLIAAQRVGPSGRVFGLDMTDEMLTLARQSAEQAGLTNVEFLRGTIEAIPLPAASIDVVISNCVINLAADKTAVFREIARVLRAGGRMGVADIVAEDRLSTADRAERGSHVGCVAGALSISEVRAGLEDAGLTEIDVSPTHAVADGMFSAIVTARRSLAPEPADRAPVPVAAGACCP